MFKVLNIRRGVEFWRDGMYVYIYIYIYMNIYIYM